jgi:hypothetical protein
VGSNLTKLFPFILCRLHIAKEDISIRLGEMGLEILEKKLTIHVLNTYHLIMIYRLAYLKGGLEMRKIHKLNNHSNNEASYEMALYSGQFKGKCRNYCKMAHKLVQCKNQGNQNGGSNGGNASGSICCTYCRKPGHVKQNCLKLKRKDSRLNNTNNNSSNNSNNSNCDRENFESQDMVFAATSDTEKFDDDIWICDSSASSHY